MIFFFTFSLVPPSVLCGKPHETVVALDPSNHAYYPFYVKLHRCMGSKGALSPKVRRCVPSGFEELNILVYEPAKNYKRTNLLVKNHTSCTDECVASPEMCNLVLEKWDEESCTCQCMYPDEPPKEHACKERFRYVEITAGASKVPFPQVSIIDRLDRLWSHSKSRNLCDERKSKTVDLFKPNSYASLLCSSHLGSSKKQATRCATEMG